VMSGIALSLSVDTPTGPSIVLLLSVMFTLGIMARSLFERLPLS